MKYFIDTEFIESGPDHPVELLSIAIVCEDGRAFDGLNVDMDTSRANDWVKQNVLPFLAGALYDRPLLKANILAFVGDDSPEFWGWCCGFDYVLFSQLIGFNDWPSSWPYYFRDIQQTADERGINLDETDALPEDGHNALADALRIRELWNGLYEARTVATEG